MTSRSMPIDAAPLPQIPAPPLPRLVPLLADGDPPYRGLTWRHVEETTHAARFHPRNRLCRAWREWWE